MLLAWNKITLLLLLLTVSAFAQSSNFESVLIKKNVTREGELGLEIQSRYTVHGYKGKKVTVAAYLYNWDGSKLKDFDGLYKAQDGQVSASLNFEVDGDSIAVDTRDAPSYTIFLPYKQLHLSEGDYALKLQMELFLDGTNQSIGKSNFATFNLLQSEYR